MSVAVLGDQEKLGQIQTVCAGLVAAFAYLVDHQRYDELVALFTEDCVFERPGVLLNGREELLRFMHSRPADTVSRHMCTVPVVEQIDDETVRAVTLLTFYDAEPTESGPARLKGMSAFAEYRDELRHTAEGWRIARRTVVPILI